MTDANEITEIPMVCVKCKRAGLRTIMGRVILHEKKPHLDDGAFLVLMGQKRCHVCGKAFFWDGQRIRWADLVESYKKKLCEGETHAVRPGQFLSNG